MTEDSNARLWIKLTLPGIGQIGPGKVELLRRISRHRSIAAAARSMGMSYRRAWLLVDEMNKLFEEPLVAKWQGGKSQGGASLTALGKRLIEDYETMLRRAQDANRALLDDISGYAAKRGRHEDRG
jgi:molybdate transport system regulatory protein